MDPDGSAPVYKPKKSNKPFANGNRGPAFDTSGSPTQMCSADSYEQHTTDDDHMDIDEQNQIDNTSDSEDSSILDQPFTRMFANVGGTNAQSLSFMDLVQRLGQTHGASAAFHQTQTSEYHSVLENLNQRDDTYLILESVRDLSERLLMMDGLTAERTIPIHKLSKSLVSILHDPMLVDDLELHLVTCRCLFNLVELNQDYIIDAITNGAIEALVPKLMDIVYIDLTEQCLQLLEILSHDRLSHHRFLDNDGFKACLKNLDFLTIHSQRKCLKIVANLSSSICKSHFRFVDNEFVTLLNVLLFHDDPALVESAKLTMFRVIECFKSDAEKLERLFSLEDLILQLVKIAFDSLKDERSVKPLTQFSSVTLNSLIVLANSSASVRHILLQRDLGLSIRAAILVESSSLGADIDNFRLASGSFNNLKQNIALLLLVTCFIPDPPLSEENAFLLDNSNGRAISFDSLDTEDINYLSAYIKQIYPVLVSLYHDSSDSKLRLHVLRELYKIFCVSDSLDGHLQFETKSSLVILADAFYEARDLLITKEWDDLSATEVAQISAACLIVLVVLRNNNPEIINYLQREGVLANLKDIRYSLESKTVEGDTFDEKSPDHLNLLKKRKILDSLNQIETGISNLESTSHKTYNALQDILATIQKKFKSSDYTNIKLVWNGLAMLLGSEDPPTCHELLTLGVLDHIQRLICSKDVASPTPIDSFVDVFFNNHQSLHRLVSTLHSIVNRTRTGSTPQGAKDLFLLRRLLVSRRILLKLLPDISDEETAPFEGKDIMLLVTAVSSFATIENFVVQRLNSEFKSQSDLEQSDSSSPLIDSKSHSVLFFYRGAPVLRTTSLYGMLLAYSSSNSREKVLDAVRICSSVHEISFKIVPLAKLSSFFSVRQLEPLSSTALNLLNRISRINESLYSTLLYVPPRTFENRSVSLKTQLSLNDSYVVPGSPVPEWCLQVMLFAPLVLPFDVKMHFFNSVSFGMARRRGLLNGRQARPNTPDSRYNGLSNFLGEPEGYSTKTKLQVRRKAVFKSALKILQEYNALTSILEIQFYDEVGSGLGPTLEFYSLVSRHFSGLISMWRSPHSTTEVPESGLFPQPILENSRLNQKTIALFKALGQFVARAIVDSRNLDFYFSPVFLRAIQDWPGFCQTIENSKDIVQLLKLLRQVDMVFANSLWRLLPMALQNQTLNGSPGSSEHSKINVSDLLLTFVVPGYPDLELVENGKELIVTENNLVEYIGLVSRSILMRGISKQVMAFQEGLSSLLPQCFMQLFSIIELNDLMGHSPEDWTLATLEKCIETDHGYSLESKAIRNLLAIISEFLEIERREFLQFLTGSPRLPIGGFGQLNPKLTIVKKHVETGSCNDDHLPSVMTCANYLKLPEYSLREVMRAKVVQAMRDGSDAFLLS